MIEYLERLVEEEKYQDAIDLADELLQKPDNTLLDVLVINNAVLLSRFELNQMEAAVKLGEAAVKLAEDLKEWDYYGTICLNLGSAHFKLKQYSDAIIAYGRYFEGTKLYRGASRLEPRVWYNIGLTQGHVGNRQASLSAFTHALEAAENKTNEIEANAIRQAVVRQYLNATLLPPVPRLLAKAECFLGHGKGPEHVEKSWFYHLELRAEFAMVTNRLQKATALSLKGLKVSRASPRHQFSFHMLLARLSRDSNVFESACAHGVAAAAYAKRINRFDLASQAVDLVYDTANGQG